MTNTLWTLLILQIGMGLFDTVAHHEGTERLAWRPGSRRELQLHGVRNLLYAVLFMALGWYQPRGGLALGLAALLVTELAITLWDFVEEDRSRKLPASERITHTLLTLNYGVILALMVPLIAVWASEPSGLVRVDYGWLTWLCGLAAVGVVISGTRDLFAAARAQRLLPSPAVALAAALGRHQYVLITGGTGFVGSRLVEALVAAGHGVTVLTRRREAAAGLPAPVTIVTDLAQIDSAAQIDAVVNLAGEPLSDGLWTKAKRERIIASRVAVTKACVALIARLKRKPEVLVSGSAIGWYGLRGDEVLDEGGDAQDCFSHDVCREWEGAAAGAGIRTVLLRIGLVLDNSGGMLARMLTPFEFGLGGRFGHTPLDELDPPRRSGPADRPRDCHPGAGGPAQCHRARASHQPRVHPRAGRGAAQARRDPGSALAAAFAAGPIC